MYIKPFDIKGGQRQCLKSPAFSRLNTNPNSILGPSGYFADEKEFEMNLGRILKAFTSHIESQSPQRKPILVAMDDLPLARKHLKAVIQGLNDLGFDVYTCFYDGEGYLPVPIGTAAYVTRYFNEFNKFHSELSGALVLTSASHPLNKIGFRFLNPDGTMFSTAEMKQLDKQVDLHRNVTLAECSSLNVTKGKEYYFDFTRGNYRRYLRQLVDFKKLKFFTGKLFYSPLHGATKAYFDNYLQSFVSKFNSVVDHFDVVNVVEKLHLGSVINSKNVAPLVKEMTNNDNGHKVGFVNNGDGGVMRVMDNHKKLVAPDDINALLIWHLIENKRRDGIIIKTQDVGQIVDDVAARYGLRVIEVPIGFQYVGEAAKRQKEETLLLGIDGQGGVSSIGHIPIKDGLLADYLVLEMLGESGITLEKLQANLKADLKRGYVRKHIQLNNVDPKKVMTYFKNLGYSHRKLGLFEVNRKRTVEQTQGFNKQFSLDPGREVKIFFKDDSWMLARLNNNNPNIVDVWLEVTGDVVKNRWSTQNLAEAKYQNFKVFFESDIKNKLGWEMGQQINL